MMATVHSFRAKTLAMPDSLAFKGFIRDVKYRAFLGIPLPAYPFADFDIRRAKSAGMLEFPGGQIGYSRWISPKRTRSYPSAGLYNVYNAPMRLTVIPVLKDEGLDGDLDRIQYSTISWMNLLNVYIVLAYYSDARKNVSVPQRERNKLTAQKLDSEAVNRQISEISSYKQSALHWNRTLMETKFVSTYQAALAGYADISERTGVKVHPRAIQDAYLAQVMRDFEAFKTISHRGSKGAASRELGTRHGLEYLNDGAKATLEIENYLGGIYYLTADEIIQEQDLIVLQESKNSTAGFLPSLADIKDGLFKLILFSNLDTLSLNDQPVPFSTRLKLTGATVQGKLRLPTNQSALDQFKRANQAQLLRGHVATLEKLNLEAQNNQKLEIEIGGNR